MKVEGFLPTALTGLLHPMFNLLAFDIDRISQYLHLSLCKGLLVTNVLVLSGYRYHLLHMPRCDILSFDRRSCVQSPIDAHFIS